MSTRYRLVTHRWYVVREGEAPSPKVLSEPRAVVELARDLIPDDDREHFWVIFVNTQNHYQAAHDVSTGTLSASLVHPREVFGPALREGAAAIILVHNHPSGDPTPSKEDLRLTQRLVDAGKLLDVRVLDHVIIGNGSGRWSSLAQSGAI